ncbi:hypothetical protein DVH24_016819 [Malus domestica]|uniref:Uncharacterized protein n=1 Tax=Malus domestica TaxID=3750 RepID=A0A498HWR1_MALDO|nr:hypothetical protein DVH24_016819 [Malus domestica]
MLPMCLYMQALLCTTKGPSWYCKIKLVSFCILLICMVSSYFLLSYILMKALLLLFFRAWTCFLFRIFRRCNIPMVAMGTHIGYSLTNRKAATGLRANKRTLLEMKLQKGMVELVKKIFRIKRRRLNLLRELNIAHTTSGIDKGLPLDLREHVPEEFRVEIDRLFNHLLYFNAQREAVGHAFDVRRQHVVG